MHTDVSEGCLRHRLNSIYLSIKMYLNIMGQGLLLPFMTEGTDKLLCLLLSFPVLMTLR